MPDVGQSAIVGLLVLVVVQAGVAPAASSPPERRSPQTNAQSDPALPAGAIRLVNYVRHGLRVAICAEEPGPAIEQGERSRPRTRVWVYDGRTTRQVATAPGTCDPAWAPDGNRVAVVAPDGLWVLSSDLRTTTHLVETRHIGEPANEFALHTLSQPRWAPDASALAFLVSSGGTSWVEVVNVKTGEAVYSSDPETYEFAWGPDSQSLHFGSRVVRLPE